MSDPYTRARALIADTSVEQLTVWNLAGQIHESDLRVDAQHKGAAYRAARRALDAAASDTRPGAKGLRIRLAALEREAWAAWAEADERYLDWMGWLPFINSAVEKA